MFEHLLNQTLLNCYILFKKQNPGSSYSHMDFRIQLITRMLAEYHKPADMPRRGHPSHDLGNPLCLTDRHFPKILPATNKKDNPTKSAKSVVQKIKTKSQECDVALCVVPCFELYYNKCVTHTKQCAACVNRH